MTNAPPMTHQGNAETRMTRARSSPRHWWGIGGAFVIAVLAAASDPVGTRSKWVYDEVALTNGAQFQGIILKELPAGIEFQVIRRLPGRPTVTLTTFFAAREVAQDRIGAMARVVADHYQQPAQPPR